MYRLTVYDINGDKSVDELEDEEDLRESVDIAMNDLEDHLIKSFVVSRVGKGNYQKPFWEKEE